MIRFKKLLVFIFLFTANVAGANYLDDWPDDALCGWMQQPSPLSTLFRKLKKEASYVLTVLHQLIPMYQQIKALGIQELKFTTLSLVRMFYKN